MSQLICSATCMIFKINISIIYFTESIMQVQDSTRYYFMLKAIQDFLLLFNLSEFQFHYWKMRGLRRADKFPPISNIMW